MYKRIIVYFFGSLEVYIKFIGSLKKKELE